MKQKQEKKYTDVDNAFIECLKDLRDLYDESGYSEFIINHYMSRPVWATNVIINENGIYLLYCSPYKEEDPFTGVKYYAPSETIDLEQRRYSLLNGKLKETRYLSGWLTLEKEFINSYDCIRQKFENKLNEKNEKIEQLEIKRKQLKKGRF